MKEYFFKMENIDMMQKIYDKISKKKFKNCDKKKHIQSIEGSTTIQNTWLPGVVPTTIVSTFNCFWFDYNLGCLPFAKKLRSSSIYDKLRSSSILFLVGL